MATWIKMPLGMELGLSPGDFVLDGDPAPPQFSANFCCARTAGCIKTPLGMELGLSPGDVVLDGDSTPSQKGAEPPVFGASLLWPNDRMDQDAT